MTRPDLDAIEARADAATPGPWFHVSTDDESNMCADYVGTVDRGDRHDNRRGMAPGTPRFGEVVAITLIQTPLLAAHESDLFGENAAMIAHARTDIPALVAYARELETTLAWHEDRHGTRAEQEADDAEVEEEWSAVAALSDDEVRALNEAEGLDSPAQRQRFDTFLRVLAREAALRAERDELLARARELEAVIANERGTGPTTDGWYWADGQWNREADGGIYTVDRNPCPTDDDINCDCPWLPTTWTARFSRWDDEECKNTRVIGTYDTAREAIRAASVAP